MVNDKNFAKWSDCQSYQEQDVTGDFSNEVIKPWMQRDKLRAKSCPVAFQCLVGIRNCVQKIYRGRMIPKHWNRERIPT